jgi:hypothetical protein
MVIFFLVMGLPSFMNVPLEVLVCFGMVWLREKNSLFGKAQTANRPGRVFPAIQAVFLKDVVSLKNGRPAADLVYSFQ